MITARGWFVVIASVLVLLLVGAHARAHDENGDPNWIAEGSYRDGNGIHCCGVGDCFRLKAEDVRLTPAGLYLVKFNETVPFAEATPSEDGKIWRCQRGDGSRRCFFYPAGGV